MRLGLSSWSYPWSIGVRGYPQPERPLTALDLVEKTRGFGLNVLQLADNFPLDKMTAAELRDLRDAAERAGVTLEAGTRGIEPEHLTRYLDCTVAIGAKLLRTLSHTATFKPNIREVRQILSQALPAFERAGVVIALENNEAHPLPDYVGLMREVQSPFLGICMDTANSLGALFRTDEVVKALGPYCVCLHYKDFAIERFDHRMGFMVKGTPAGDGKVDGRMVVSEVLRNAKRGPVPNLILELWPPYQGDIEKSVALEQAWVDKSVGFLKTLLAETNPRG